MLAYFSLPRHGDGFSLSTQRKVTRQQEQHIVKMEISLKNK